MQNSSRKKVKLKKPINLFCALSVIVESIILSLVIHINFFFVFIALFLVYVSAYAFFEQRRRSFEEYQDDDYYDDEEEDEEEDEEDQRGYERPVQHRRNMPERTERQERPVRTEENDRRVSYSKRDFDVIKSADFRDSKTKNDNYEDDSEDNSWRAMYNKASDEMENTSQSSFDEDYKKYFSTTLPDREEIARNQYGGKRRKNDTEGGNYGSKGGSSLKNDDSLEGSVIYETESSSSEENTEDNSEDEEEHLFDSDELDNQTAAIQSKVSDLIGEKEETTRDNKLQHSVTAKLKLFKKTRSNKSEEYPDDDFVSGDIKLIDELYSWKNNSFEEADSKFEAAGEENIQKRDIDDIESETSESVHKMTATEKKIITLLKDSEIDAVIKDIYEGASFTRYEIKPKSMSKLNKIRRLESDFERRLNMGPVRVADIGSNKATAGIEVPNKDRKTVYFKDLILSDNYKNAKNNTSCILGTDVYNEVVLSDLRKMPHLLVISSSPEEKNMCIDVLISSILSRVSVFDVDFIMIDVKKSLLNKYEGIPNLFTSIINFADDAISELTALINMVNTRLDLFDRQNVNDILSYNASKPGNTLSHIVVVISELADLMATDPKHTEDIICTLAQKARSAGIYLVIGTTDCSEEVLTGLIKANIPSRICFRLESEEESLNALDISGAEKLLGKGDMLYYPKGLLSPKRLQGAFISEDEVEEIIDKIL